MWSTPPESIRGFLSEEQYRLYKMIWQKFVSSQMMPAVFDQTTIEIAAKADRTYDFRISGSIMKFAGVPCGLGERFGGYDPSGCCGG